MAPPIAAPILPPGVVTKAFSRLFQNTFFLNLLYKDYMWDLNETLQDCSSEPEQPYKEDFVARKQKPIFSISF